MNHETSRSWDTKSANVITEERSKGRSVDLQNCVTFCSEVMPNTGTNCQIRRLSTSDKKTDISDIRFTYRPVLTRLRWDFCICNFCVVHAIKLYFSYDKTVWRLIQAHWYHHHHHHCTHPQRGGAYCAERCPTASRVNGSEPYQLPRSVSVVGFQVILYTRTVWYEDVLAVLEGSWIGGWGKNWLTGLTPNVCIGNKLQVLLDTEKLPQAPLAESVDFTAQYSEPLQEDR